MPAAGGPPREFGATACTRLTSETPVSWAPGALILYQRHGNRNYFFIDPATSAERPLLTDESLGWVFGPRVSPDRSRLAVF